MERQVIVAKSAGFCFGVERAVARVFYYNLTSFSHKFLILLSVPVSEFDTFFINSLCFGIVAIRIKMCPVCPELL